MPSVNSFKNAFNLNIGSVFSDNSSKFIIKNITIFHRVVHLYKEYKFPMTIEFLSENKKNSENHLLKIFNDEISRKNEQIIYSDYGSPYECSVDEPEIDNVYEENEKEIIIVLFTTGIAIRKYDLPTLYKQMHIVRKKSITSKSTIEEDDYDITTAHFKGGKCEICKSIIEIGSKIARKKDNKVGHWCHIECL